MENTNENIKLAVRFFDALGKKRDVPLFDVTPSTLLSTVRNRLAKQFETDACLLTLSLGGRPLAMDQTLKQAYGSSSFALHLDARVSSEEKVAETVNMAPPQRSAGEPFVLPEPVYEYVEKTWDEELVCSICDSPAVDPVVSSCDHLFCSKCIRTWLASAKNTCPNCRAPCASDSFKPSGPMRNMLNKLKVYCSNKARGCGVKCARGDLAQHLDRTCELNACFNSETGCKWQGVLQTLPAHLERDCEHALARCPEGCGVEMERRAIAEHVKSSCAEAIRRAEERQREAARRAEEERKRQEKLAAEEAQRLQEQRARELEKLCDELNPAAEDVITLDVGGVKFKTSRTTLTKHPLSVLGVMFSERQRKLKKNSDGIVFLDAPPKPFGYVLSWLQEGVFPTDLGSYDAELLLQHAKKWRFDDLVAALGGEVSVGGGGPPLSQHKVLSLMQVAGCANGGQLSLPGADLSGLYLGGSRLEKAILTGARLRRTNFGCSNLSGSDLSGTDLQGADLGKANLSSANLSNANLSSANLSETVLKRANLTGVDLSGRNLSGYDLSSANLSSANLSFANLSSANLSSANLSNSNLCFANLSYANLSNTDLSNANLSSANLSKTVLKGANLTGVDLSGRDLSGYDLSSANLSNANLSSANLSSANLSKTVLKGANLTGVDLSGRDLSGYDLSNANLSNANLSSANLSSANLSKTMLKGANLTGVDLRGRDLSGYDLSSANLSCANLSKTMLKGANLTGVDLSGRDLSGYDLSSANLNSANLSKTMLKGANLTGVDLSGRDLSGYDLSSANLSNANLSNANLSNTVITGAIASGCNLTGVQRCCPCHSYPLIVVGSRFQWQHHKVDL